MAILGVKREHFEAAFDQMETKDGYGPIENYFAEALGIHYDPQRAVWELYVGQH